MRINSGLNELLVLLMNESWHPAEHQDRARKKQNLLPVRNYLETHYTEKIVLDELADRFLSASSIFPVCSRSSSGSVSIPMSGTSVSQRPSRCCALRIRSWRTSATGAVWCTALFQPYLQTGRGHHTVGVPWIWGEAGR